MNQRSTDRSTGYGSVRVPGVHPEAYGVALEGTPKWIRVFFSNQCVVDTRNARLMFETGQTPVYYFPRDDVRTDLLSPSDKTYTCPHKGEAQYYDLMVGEDEVTEAAWSYEQPNKGLDELKEFIAFYWNKMDAWYEEDQEVFLHPTNPYHRIDVRESSRPVELRWKGVPLAATTRPVLLFETDAPVRYYVPRLDVNFEHLVPSDTRTVCCYKGFTSQYLHARVGDDVLEDVAWCYRQPNSGYEAIQNRLAFYQEKLELLTGGPPDNAPSNL